MKLKGMASSRRQFMQTAAAVLTLAATGGASGVGAATRAGSRQKSLVASNLVVSGCDPSDLTTDYLAMLMEAGVNCVVWNAGGHSRNDLPYFVAAYEFMDQHADKVTIAKSVKDIRRAYLENKLAVVLGWQTAKPLEDEKTDWRLKPLKTNLRAYVELGLRICGITYNIANYFGGGCLDPHIGLSKAGRYLVEELHKHRVIVDIGGHTGEQASLDVLAMSSGVPIVCSHSNAAAITDNPRNTSDRVLEGIARSGGVVGLCPISDFVTRGREDASIPDWPQATLDDWLEHFDYLKRLIGADHIGLGPDFTQGWTPDFTFANPDEEAFVFPSIMISAQQPPIVYVKGFENIKEIVNVEKGLRDRGWSDAEIKKVFGDNWLRAYGQVWDG
jgi:membrane dipeptidase